jgi:glucose-1-phosphate thymidylyltransferase
MKGIVLAGGTGSRLWPITRSVSKQLLPIYDKPMIYYPISTLMLAGIREILIITTPEDQSQYQGLLGDGSALGVSFQYESQPEPRGLAQAFTIGEEFLAGASCVLILGDNIFHGAGLGRDIKNSFPEIGAHIFTYEVSNPSDYGVLELNHDGTPMSISEKPESPVSNLAVTGVYFFDERVVQFAKDVKPSKRGELEITTIIGRYLKDHQLTYTKLSRGAAWLDTGNPNSLNDAAAYVRIIEERTGLKIACLEEISLMQGWINSSQFSRLADSYGNSSYGHYLKKILSLQLTGDGDWGFN